MAQATLSCPFGAIHLEDRRGTAQNGHSVSIFAHPTPFVASRHLPLTGGVGPRTPIYGSYPLEQAESFRRAKSEWVSEFPPGHFVVADFVSLASPGPGKARSLHRSSSPTQTRFAGLCVGGRLRRPVWVENFSWCGSIGAPGFFQLTLPVRDTSSAPFGGTFP